MKPFLYLFIALSPVIAGCSSAPIAQNANEYREQVKKGGFGSKFETYEVKRSYSKVAKTLKDKSEECLNATIDKSTCYTRLNCKENTVYYTPTVISDKTKTELQVQWRRDPWDSIFLGGKEPPATGLYIVVVDVASTGKNKTKVNLYGPSLENLQTVPKAIKHWIDGSNLGCPDLTKPYYY